MGALPGGGGLDQDGGDGDDGGQPLGTLPGGLSHNDLVGTDRDDLVGDLVGHDHSDLVGHDQGDSETGKACMILIR